MKKLGTYIWLCVLISLLCGCSEINRNECEKAEGQNETEVFLKDSEIDTESEETEELLDRPGGLEKVEEIQQPDQSIVGNRNKYSFDMFEELAFLYCYNGKTKEERLVLVERPKGIEQRHVKLLVLKTSLGGWNGFKESLTTNFEATVLAYKNITFEEGQYAFAASVPGSGMAKYYNVNEIVDFTKEINNTVDIQYYLGSIYSVYPVNAQDAIVNELESGKYVSVLSNMCEVESEQLLNKIEIYYRIFERFNLQKLVYIN